MNSPIGDLLIPAANWPFVCTRGNYCWLQTSGFFPAFHRLRMFNGLYVSVMIIRPPRAVKYRPFWIFEQHFQVLTSSFEFSYLKTAVLDSISFCKVCYSGFIFVFFQLNLFRLKVKCFSVRLSEFSNNIFKSWHPVLNSPI